MKKYKITTYAVCDFEYEVEAETEKQAKEKFNSSEYKELNDVHPVRYHDETLMKSKEIK